MTTTKDRTIATALALALCLALISACGGGGTPQSSAGDGAAARVGKDLGDGDAASGNREKAPERERGVDTSHGFISRGGVVGKDLSPSERREFEEGWMDFVHCLREEGIDMKDPKFLDHNRVYLDEEGVDSTSPAFNAAREACQGHTLENHGIDIGG